MSTPLPEAFAWLEDSNHQQIPIRGSCSIGRSASNQIVLTSDTISRRHAMIQVQRDLEYWLVDFGSRNGTYLNGQRMARPARLSHGDRFSTGPFEFTFRLHAAGPSPAGETVMTDATVTDVRTIPCWLLVADIIDSTQLLRNLPLDQLPAVTGRWMAECKQTIEEHGGRINQFMGDGFFAFWRDTPGAAVMLGKTLRALSLLQEQANPAFRIVAHYGAVALGGFAVGEEERISGGEVHFVFRMEKLAGQLSETRLLSHAAWELLRDVVQAREVGRHVLPGFDTPVSMYAF